MSFSFRIERGAYLSLSAPLEWNDIPPFAVLTGANGSGKSQLLTLMHLTATRNRPHTDVLASFDGLEHDPLEAALVPSEWYIPQPQVATLQEGESQLMALARTLFEKTPAPHAAALRERLADSISRASRPEDLVPELCSRDLLETRRQPGQLLHQLGHVFRQHHLDRCDMKLHGAPEADIRAKLGPPLWDVANELLADADLPYRFSSPERLALREPYLLELLATDLGCTISPKDLSSGERVLLGLLMALFSSSQFNLHSKLLLLDEPDAHLHTVQIALLLRLLRRTLVEKYGCKVIMTSHRPDTVVQVEQSALFEMRRSDLPRVIPATTPSAILRPLTGHLVEVLPALRCVFTEDDDDAIFYGAIRDGLSAAGQLEQASSLGFYPASLGQGRAKVAGGKSVVRSTVKKLRTAGLPMVFGIEDADGEERQRPLDGILRLPRHSIENYLYDPLTVYATLVDLRDSDTLNSFPMIAPGDQWKLAQMSAEELQRIADATLRRYPQSSAGSRDPSAQVAATLIHGQEIVLPRWLLETRGHDLMSQVFHGVNDGLSRERLLHALRSWRLIYTDLLDLLRSLRE